MGVKDLWQLLAPVGRRVSIETLEGKVLAIDMSIWLTQFIKAMRDEEGKMVKNAHLIGTLRRILKLLYNRIRPVFVFDGSTPALKLRVIQFRRKTHDKAEQNRKIAVHRLLLAQLKQQILNQKPPGENPSTNEAAQNFSAVFRPPTAKKNDKLESGITVKSNNNSSSSSGPLVTAAPDTLEDLEWTDGSQYVRKKNITDNNDDESDELDEPMWTLPEDNDALDVDVLTSLPIHIRKRIIEDAKRRERARSRATFMPVADNPILYSQTQLANFLQSSKLNQRFDEARQKLEGDIQENGKKIAAENKKYQFIPRQKGILESPKASTRRLIRGSTEEGKDLDEDEEFTDNDWARAAPVPSHNYPSHPNRGKKIISFEEDNSPVEQSVSVKEEKIRKSTFKNRFFDTMEVDDEQDFSEFAESVPKVKLSKSLSQSDMKETHLPSVSFSSDLIANNEESLSRDGDEYGRGGGFFVDPVDKITDSEKLESSVTEHQSTSIEEECYPKEANSNNNIIPEVEALKNILWENDEQDLDNIAWETDEALEKNSTDSSQSGSDTYSSSDESGEDSRASIIENLNSESVIVHIESTVADVSSNNIISLVDSNPSVNEPYQEKDIETIVLDEIKDEFKIKSDLFADDDREFRDSQSTITNISALSRAISTASNMGDWAGRVVRRVVKEHISNHSNVPISGNMVSSTGITDRSASLQGSSSTITSTFREATTRRSDFMHSVTEKASNDQLTTGYDLSTEIRNSTVFDLSTDIPNSKPTTMDLIDEAEMIDNQTGSAATDSLLLDDDEDIEATKKQLAASARDTERITEDMKNEVLKLIQAFDLPYIIAPFEAEAQCAILEEMGVVDGTITEDSDSFLFGAKSVFKNIFSDRKFVEVYLAEDIQRELGLTREDLIALAFFLGSDYTEGIHGVGIVNAMEIIQAFSMRAEDGGPIEGLKKFRQWLEGYDFANDILSSLKEKKSKSLSSSSNRTESNGRKSNEKNNIFAFDEVEAFSDGSDDEEDRNGNGKMKSDDVNTQDMSEIERRMVDFEKKHKNGRSKWTVPGNFPDESVAKAYFHPQTSRNPDPFPFIPPARSKVRRFVAEVLGWTDAQLNSQIDPVLQRYSDRTFQTRMDSFYTMTYQDDARFAKIASERLRDAVEKITGKDSTHLAVGKRISSPQLSQRRVYSNKDDENEVDANSSEVQQDVKRRRKD